MDKKLVCVIMGQNASKFLNMSLKSVKDADWIVYCDGGSSEEEEDATHYIIDDNDIRNIVTIKNDYNQLDKTMNGKQRNFYLNYLKNNFPNDWCLVLDADEVVGDLNEIKKVIQYAEDGVYSVKMRHFIGSLGHEDATQKEHNVLNRLFKISCADKYPEVEHPVLLPLDLNARSGVVVSTTIWHLGYVPNMWYFKNRYESHLAKSNMPSHTPEYLKDWYYNHLFGTYPKSEVHREEIPAVILEEFGFTFDEIYFKNRRNIGMNHLLDAINHKDFFKCKNALEVGCGLGMRVWAMNKIGIDAMGSEISEYAVKNSAIPDKVFQEDLENPLSFQYGSYDLVIAYDVLEHIDLKKIESVVDYLIRRSAKYILISVPVDTDPNFYKDTTHKICRPKTWWKRLFEDKGHKVFDVPSNFLYPNQQFYVEVKK